MRPSLSMCRQTESSPARVPALLRVERRSERRGGLERETLSDGTQRSAGQFKAAVRTDSGAKADISASPGMFAWGMETAAPAAESCAVASSDCVASPLESGYGEACVAATMGFIPNPPPEFPMAVAPGTGGCGKTRDGARVHQDLADRVTREVVDELRAAEADFDFCGMHVDVDFVVRHFEEEQRRGKNIAREDIAIGLVNRVEDEAIAHEAAIDEDVDAVAIRALDFGPRREAVDADAGAFFLGSSSGSVMAARKAAEAVGISTSSSSDCLPKS